MNIPPLVIFGATFIVWITAKGELGKYWGFATVAKKKAAGSAPSVPSVVAPSQEVNAVLGNPIPVDNGSNPLTFGITP